MHGDTKMKFTLSILFLIFFFTRSFAQKNPNHFKTDLDFGGGTVISTFLDLSLSNDQFKMTSPKNADKRIVGGTKARLGRLMGKLPKKGKIITIKGTQKMDSLLGETKIPMFGKLKFKGTIHNGSLNGQLYNKDGVSTGTVLGQNSTEDRMDFSALYPQLIKTIKDNIYSKRELETKQWKSFEKDLGKLFNKAHDDIEIFFGFSILAQKLPFSHLYFLIGDTAQNENEKESEEKINKPKSVVFEERNLSTAYLQIKNFSSSQEELADILPKIIENKAYKNLIVDLRNNGGGGVGPAFEFAKYIVTEDLEVGYFPTNRLNYNGFEPELFKTLPEMQPKSTNEFGKELKKTPGVKLIFKKPNNPVFTGKLYILTNGGTASTCEPIVYALKSRKKAIIIGETTCGAMLSASPFGVSGKYMLFIPVGDFYTHDGVRLDRVGVEPDIKVKSEDADEKAMEMINERKER
ncbi:MAG: S41 family peptidase [Bacteroidia bacterium]|nr:S41 family peptidase [Bacteroidia bacterium]